MAHRSAQRSLPRGSRAGALRTGGLVVACLLVLALLGLTLTAGSRTPRSQAPTAAGADATLRSAAVASLRRIPAVARAGSALRRRECAEAQAALTPLLSRSESRPLPGSSAADGPDRTRIDPRILSGFFAHACEDVDLAAARLAEPGPSGLFEDWRLLLLAESTHALRRFGEADEALDALLSEHPGSPLFRRALLTAIEQAAANGRAERTLELVRRSRRIVGLSHGMIGRIEAIAWESSHGADREAAARRLLSHDPELAAALGVLDDLRAAAPAGGGEVDWRTILSPAEMERRADALLDSGRPGEAVALLEAVPPGDRGAPWRLLFARALTREGRPGKALEVLDGIENRTESEAGRVAWERALAAESLASPLHGGASLSPRERRRMREASREHLARVVNEAVHSGHNRELAGTALRRLFASYATGRASDRGEPERFERAVATLRLLRRIDPRDTAGASYLWSHGWEEYRGRNYSGAIGYWSELAALYPESRDARRGRYWTARAFEELGHEERAREILHEVTAVGSTDFYRKHALARLARLEGPGGERGLRPSPFEGGPGSVARQAWPEDPALARARLLTDLGLDALALTEIEELGGIAARSGHAHSGARAGATPDPRAAEALTGLILARRGQRRAAIPHLRRAFPVLGGPHQDRAPIEAQHLYYPVDFSEAVDAAAESAGVPHHLVYGMIREESAFDVTALSHAGARGLMQLMPATGRETARRLGIPFSTASLQEPQLNVRLGAEYFARVLAMFGGETELALAGYNGGPYRMKRLWRRAGPDAEIDAFTEGLPIEESKAYVKRVVLFANSYRDLYGI